MTAIRSGGKRRNNLLGLSNSSPVVWFALTLPLAIFTVIIMMGHNFVTHMTEMTPIHPPDHPLHVIGNPNGAVKAIHTAKENLAESIAKPANIVIEENQEYAQRKSDKEEKNNNSNNDVEYHIVFSTGCSAFQDWQSYVFFYQAMKIQQPGTVTRIVSGCNPTEEETLRKIFDDTIAPMAPDRFKIHFTPDFAKILKPGIDYPYFNKPWYVSM